MTTRCLFFTLIAVGCAAAVPAAHHLAGDGGAHHAWPHGAHGEAAPTTDAIRAHVDAALDTLGLAPEVRAEAKRLLEPHLERAFAFREKFDSGELRPEDAAAEHERIMADAKADLAKVLTAEQIEQFVDALHLHDGAMRGGMAGTHGN